MNFEGLIFKTVVDPASLQFITIVKIKDAYGLRLSAGAQQMCEEIAPTYNAIELFVANDSVFAIKPVTKKKGGSKIQFSATALRAAIKNMKFNKRLLVVAHNNIIVCDLNKN